MRESARSDLPMRHGSIPLSSGSWLCCGFRPLSLTSWRVVRLRAGGYVLSSPWRAPGGAGGPGFREACSTQRDLSEKVARSRGLSANEFKAERIAIAGSAHRGVVARLRALDLGAADSRRPSAIFWHGSASSWPMARLHRWRKGPGRSWWPHGANIDALTNYNPAQAEIVVVRTRANGTLGELGRIPAPER
jgi:hypothetical protein